MIQLRKMKADEFPQYKAYFIQDYAAEISSNYDVTMETALARAKASIEDDLGQGVDTPDQVLLCPTLKTDESQSPVGYLWCKPNIKDRTIFISDFYIFPQFRGLGYGTSALIALEELYSNSAYDEIRLRVAADNKSAERLYLRAGYMPTGINMRKAITNN
ncbi:GNAT family N-acetyltransferase [Ahrensia kielensis]|uniref:GNAT family N-acetyltransferase n=1 Tax=Ahrensia kielensis TaxID=76980 RepID=UPI0003787BF6|nr:GNAT family N-acetyltransferase [Ahrensia kielensis]